MAKAAKFTIAEVEEIVEVGEIEPENVHTPNIYVDAIVKAECKDKPIEILTNSENMAFNEEHLKDPKYKIRAKIAKRAAQEIGHD